MTTTAILPNRRLSFSADHQPDLVLEWLVTNGLGGYASGTVRGPLTRRFHGVLVSSLPSPLGRTMCLNDIGVEALVGARTIRLGAGGLASDAHGDVAQLTEFVLEGGLPIWKYEAPGFSLEKRVVMPYGQNTTHVMFRVLRSDAPVTIRVRPRLHVRPHEGSVEGLPAVPQRISTDGGGVEVDVVSSLPVTRWLALGERIEMHLGASDYVEVDYAIEAARGYDHAGHLWSPGWIDIECGEAREACFTVSTESWDAIRGTSPSVALAQERARRETLVEAAGSPADPFVAELTLAADQFITLPVGRADEVARARAAGDEPRTVIAGYPWFTDWGRDTMISLEGLTLSTGRVREAGCILRTFAHYVRDGLIPNMFPEGERTGLYHTADATLWFFHALYRYVGYSNDRATLTTLLPTLVDIAEHHVAGTRFGIGVDPKDQLLTQGAEGYQLTWMDAKVGDWVVTPRRGKAVEINALWHNALKLLAQWLAESGRDAEADRWRGMAAHVAESFNRRFWNAADGWLFDVVDGEHGDDPACRPNQLFAISLDHPVLDPARWRDVLDVVVRRLLTPAGLRTLAPGHKDYRSRYDGDLHARDAAYHQGTVWPWLIGPFVDAWTRVHPDDYQQIRRLLAGLPDQLDDSCIGSISEIFDAEPPYAPRGCVAQAWSVAEVLRAWRCIYQAKIPTGQ